jgi:potassium/hydrogen antiporter
MQIAHEVILIAGALVLAAIIAGLLSSRTKAPLLLVFLGLGMLAGEDGLGGIVYDDFQTTYLFGSIALVVILFEGGLKTTAPMIRVAGLPALALATVGTAICAAIVGAATAYLAQVDWRTGFLLGAMMAPTDAAAVTSVMRASGLKLPLRVDATLEVESGLNDPVSVFLTLLLVEALLAGHAIDLKHAVLLFLREMIGGTVVGIAGGFAMSAALRWVRAPESLYPTLLLAAALVLFGAAQLAETSGFLAIYLAGVIVAHRAGPRAQPVGKSFESFGWIAQIGLFLGLGLLVTPHTLVPLVWTASEIALVLIFVARPVSAFLCLKPFRFGWGESAFIGWVGLRGGVPIYLAIIPVLAGVPRGELGFAAAFVIVLVSLVVQGWTVGPAARLFRLTKHDSEAATNLEGGSDPAAS